MSEQEKTKTVEIWIRGRLLCEVPEDNEALEFFEMLVRSTGKTINEKEEDNKIIRMV